MEPATPWRRHAARWSGVASDVLVLSGDTPLVTEELLQALVDGHRAAGADVTVLSLVLTEPGDYGRVIRDGVGRARSDRRGQGRRTRGAGRHRGEQLDLRLQGSRPLGRNRPPRAAQRAGRAVPHRLCSPHRRQRRRSATSSKRRSPELALGVNTRVELARAADLLRQRINEGHMLAGVTIVDPASTWIEAGVELEPRT